MVSEGSLPPGGVPPGSRTRVGAGHHLGDPQHCSGGGGMGGNAGMAVDMVRWVEVSWLWVEAL